MTLLFLLGMVAISPPAPLLGADDRTYSAAGFTEPILDVVLSSPIPGIVSARKVEEGEFVRKGSVLMELDTRIQELEVGRRKLVEDLTRTELRRAQSLAQRNAISISQEELDKRAAEFDIAALEHELAQEELRRRQITAAFDGIITELFLKPGEACQAHQALVRIVDIRRCFFVSNVDALAGSHLQAGQDVVLEIDAAVPPIPLSGRITFVSPVVDPASGLMRVRVVFDNADGLIRPGVAGRMLFKDNRYAQKPGIQTISRSSP
jgi:RND family efflux transporter MFP subunit